MDIEEAEIQITDTRKGQLPMKTYTMTADELVTAICECFRGGGEFPLRITGWSMRPLLRHGRDTVLLQPFCQESCKKGRILLYQRGDGHLVLHRVRKCLPDGYRMNGDAQVQCEFISFSQVVAQVTGIHRQGKTLSCTAPGLKLWDALWYPTRLLRPVLFGLAHSMKMIFVVNRGR